MCTKEYVYKNLDLGRQFMLFYTYYRRREQSTGMRNTT